MTCAVLGSGTMGAQIAASLALGGHAVRLWGRRAEALESAKARAGAAVDMLVEAGLVAADDGRAASRRIETVADLSSAVAGAGFVIEAVAEDLDVKRELLGAAERLADDDAILSSTTSALSASALQATLTKPGRFVVAHYAQPAHLVKLVEVVPGEATTDATTQAVIALLAACGKTPVPCPDIPGFLWARIQHAVLREFASLVGRGLTTPEVCDTILRQGYAVRLPAMGAFEHADLAGLDLINGPAAKAVWADLSNVTDPAETPVGALFAEGRRGMSSGKGFYDWTARDPEAFKRARDAEILRRVKIDAGAEPRLPESRVEGATA